MYIEELQEALVDERPAAIEHGFATLVAWPDYDFLIGSTSDIRQVTLVATCEALANDFRPLPLEICDRIEDVTGLTIARTYGAGACVVLASWPTFAEVVAL
ncbi:hypothetical protein [Aureimonas phyllosphaerae]|uniref:Uncharacterized protein n=1 Tax=Aureimonas phyllosphaerae TaxID=1166078 RepID=A0A7W6BUZ9_9HYPH|nr:hypothetical protein [Aureimonas phyllosphaerae]MBB3936549.1 hypothetical protein [Aureimonas phyllosphaerae]MBB3960587.1 hypothetical protein [Aureimonas phyllosphaerae]